MALTSVFIFELLYFMVETPQHLGVLVLQPGQAALQLQNSATFRKLDTMACSGFFFLGGGGPAAMAKLQLQNSATFSKLDTIAYSGFFFFGGGSSFIIMKILQTHKMYVSNGVLSRAQDFSRGNPCKSCMSKMFAKSRNS